MENYITKIYYHPAVAGVALFFGFLFVFLANFVNGGVCESIEHAVASACADDEIIGKGGYFFDVHQDDVFALFIFESVNDIACQI